MAEDLRTAVEEIAKMRCLEHRHDTWCDSCLVQADLIENFGVEQRAAGRAEALAEAAEMVRELMAGQITILRDLRADPASIAHAERVLADAQRAAARAGEGRPPAGREEPGT